MRVKVSNEHIEKGEVGMPKCCPVALAMKDMGMVDPFVDSMGIRFSLLGHRHYASTPNVVNDFLYKFDYGREVEPFEFELEGAEDSGPVAERLEDLAEERFPCAEASDASAFRLGDQVKVKVGKRQVAVSLSFWEPSPQWRATSSCPIRSNMLSHTT